MNFGDLQSIARRSDENFFACTFYGSGVRIDFVRKFLFQALFFNRVNLNVERKGRLVTLYHTVWDYPLIVACCLRVLVTGKLYLCTQDGLARAVWSLPETLKGGDK